jgi:hypothetical protein
VGSFGAKPHRVDVPITETPSGVPPPGFIVLNQSEVRRTSLECSVIHKSRLGSGCNNDFGNQA